MDENNFYPVFEADQVLSADHLNEIVNYLDEQDRLTRNKLIGIGIVCGLELKVSSKEIEISKGCGVTSEGYLIVQDELVCSHYRPYELPSDFYAKYRTVYEPWNMYELLTYERSLEFDDTELLANNPQFLKNKIVVLLLEMKEIPLKNCIETDCDDKGSKIEFSVKPLLVEKEDIDNFLKIVSIDIDETDAEDNEVQPLLQDIRLRRFNVAVKDLKTADDVFNSFLRLLGDRKLNKLAEILNQCYEQYKPLLTEETENPFSDVLNTFEDTLESIKETNPYFIQYFYDWIDDIIKAYNEFKDKVYFVQMMCCPDEGLFPLHLMLGRATKNTGVLNKSKYRNYFIYSPLFNNQKDLLSEIRILFRRLKILILNYKIRDPDNYAKKEIKITPSKYLDKQLSKRCIPYYYDPLGLYQCWSWSKTRRGKSKFNLSYNSNKYSNADSVVNPLMYDIEWYNFFRIEGHIGKNFSNALTNIINQRNSFNLPFEAIALSTASISRFITNDDFDCSIKDLDSYYKILLSELICKFGDIACRIARVPYKTRTILGLELSPNNALGEDNENDEEFTFEKINSIDISLLINSDKINITKLNYQKGNFIKNHCTIRRGTIGEAYINAAKSRHSFFKPDSERIVIDQNALTAHFFYFIDCVESMMSTILPYTLSDFDFTKFKQQYDLLIDEIKELTSEIIEQSAASRKIKFSVVASRLNQLANTCFDDRFKALKKEYLKRQNEYALLRNFMNYFKKHTGLEHKAGVPKGGTFVIVYQETPRPRFPGIIVDPVLGLSENIFEAERATEISNLKNLIGEAKVKDPVLLERFHNVFTKYLDECKDIDDIRKGDLTGILVEGNPETEEEFTITEATVIADFYLPYLCCSDCSPIAYVLPKEHSDILKINIAKTDFCYDDKTSYIVSASPQGGDLKASKGGLVKELGSTFFKPSESTSGINKLTYKLVGGRSANIDLKISEPMKINFDREISNGVNVQFKPSEEYPNYNWDFGDGSATSNEPSPVHEYTFEGEEKTFDVTLAVENFACISTKTIQINLIKPVEAKFDIEPRVFCSNDKEEYEFTTSPPAKKSDIGNENKLKIGKNSNKKWFFVPKNQELSETKDFHLVYKEISIDLKVVVANADFMMKIKDDGHGSFLLTLKAKQSDAIKYKWVVTQESISLTSNNSTFSISYKQERLSPGKKLIIDLTILYELNEVSCSNKKRYVLTKEIFSKHIDDVEFDNNTTE